MNMHNPPHPGKFTTEVYLMPINLSARELAAKLGVAASTLHRVLIERGSVKPAKEAWEYSVVNLKAVMRTGQ